MIMITVEGRKKKQMLVFRIKLRDFEIKKWSLKKNETMVGSTVEQR